MLLKENFTENYIRKLQTQSKRDPILLERTIFAFGLLEAITRVKMPFIFKGGTCLMLLLKHPKRLSTDIDIIVRPNTDVMYYINEASKIFPFIRFEEQKRIGKNNIEKRHFKFTYNSPINNNTLYILLDILFEENHYEMIVEKEIKNGLLLTEGENLKVKIPSISCILGDKLTAFAPHTTGILLGTNKNMEIMKQLYDISSLLDEFTDFEKVKKTYYKIVASEISYRGLDITANDCLKDTYNASLCIASRGKVFSNDYPLYVKAIRDLRTHIYSEKYSPEIAISKASKTLYMVVCIMTNTEYTRVKDYSLYLKEKIEHNELVCLKYLKKVNLKAYAYIIKADKLL